MISTIVVLTGSDGHHHTIKTAKEERFLKSIRDSYLLQHVTEPTRCRGQDEPSITDLILRNEENITDLMLFGPLGKSDHCVLSFSLNVGVEAKNPIQKYIYGSDDYTPMREELHANQDSFIEDGDVNRLWEKFKQTILNLRDKYVPLKELKYWKEKGSISLTEYLNDRKTIRKSFGPMFELNYPQPATSQHCFIQKLKP